MDTKIIMSIKFPSLFLYSLISPSVDDEKLLCLFRAVNESTLFLRGLLAPEGKDAKDCVLESSHDDFDAATVLLLLSVLGAFEGHMLVFSVSLPKPLALLTAEYAFML